MAIDVCNIWTVNTKFAVWHSGPQVAGLATCFQLQSPFTQKLRRYQHDFTHVISMENTLGHWNFDKMQRKGENKFFGKCH